MEILKIPLKPRFIMFLIYFTFSNVILKIKINIIYYAVFLEILNISGNDKKLFIYSCRTR